MAVTLILASASFLCISATAPTRSSPPIRNARLGPLSFHLAFLANCLNAAASEGTKSRCEPRPSGNPEKARRLIPPSWSAPRARALAEPVGHLDVEVLDPLNRVCHSRPP